MPILHYETPPWQEQDPILSELSRRAWEVLRLPLPSPQCNPVEINGIWIGLWQVDGGNVLAIHEECECCQRLIPVHALYSLADLRTFRPGAHVCVDCDRIWGEWQ